MAEERNRRRFRIGAGDINPVVRLETTGTLGTQYAGKAVDLTGLTIKAVHYDGTKETVTDKVLLSRRTWGTTAGEQKLEVGYKNIRLHFTVDVEAVELSKIEVTTPPTETEFAEGADIDLTGMVVTATYTDESTAEVTDYTFAPEVMASDTTEVTISYTESGVTKTTTQAVTLLSNRKKVGGKIFYIDSTGDGSYTFYNAQGVQVSEPTTGTDCTDWEYEVTGATKDKFYVFYEERYSSKIWGGSGTLIGASGTVIGTGKINTETAIGSVADVASSIWEQIRNMRTSKVGGCDDWYVPAREELNTMKNFFSWGGSFSMWTSSEYSISDAISVRRSVGEYDIINEAKTVSNYVCASRSF